MRRRSASRESAGTAQSSQTPEPAQTGSHVPQTRSGKAYAFLALGGVVLIILLIFILQNLKEVKVSFLFVHWRLPLAISLLLATILGGLVVFTAGSIRILQLRRHIRKNPPN